MREIKITVRDKIAVAPTGATIICGNSDYVIMFDFDEEWSPYATKTARFSYSRDGLAHHEDKVFTGDSVKVPILNGIHSVKVGVFAGDLHTTTGASIVCQKSILCDSGSPEQPPEDVYAQIMELVNDTYEVAKSVREDADNGVFNGEPGKPGVSDLSAYVQKTDYATDSATGVVRIGTGLKMAGAILQIHKASYGGLDSRASDYNPIVPSNLDYAIRAALINPKNITWTEDSKAAARETLGAVSKADMEEYIEETILGGAW